MGIENYNPDTPTKIVGKLYRADGSHSVFEIQASGDWTQSALNPDALNTSSDLLDALAEVARRYLTVFRKYEFVCSNIEACDALLEITTKSQVESMTCPCGSQMNQISGEAL